MSSYLPYLVVHMLESLK